MTVDEQLAREQQPVVPTRHAEPTQPTQPAVAVAEIPVVVETLPSQSTAHEPALYAVTDAPSHGLHSTSSGIPHAFPISASAQTSGFTEPATAPVLPATGAPAAEETLVAVPITTVVPGHDQSEKTLKDLLASTSASTGGPTSQTTATGGTELPSHNPFNPEHTPGYLDVQQRATTTATMPGGMTPGGMTPGQELPGGWGGTFPRFLPFRPSPLTCLLILPSLP
jgi:hypothetical protein